jgi:N-acetylneuraminic acid mutarotase
MFATAGSAQGSFYLFSGTALEKGADGKSVRRWLRDAYQFTPGRGWKRLADLPRVAVAAPSPAPLVGKHLLVLGGDDGAQVNVLPTDHRGFRRDILTYDLSSATWSAMGETPFALVTTPSMEWNGRIVIPGGEARPGIRSTEVWSASRVQK